MNLEHPYSLFDDVEGNTLEYELTLDRSKVILRNDFAFDRNIY